MYICDVNVQRQQMPKTLAMHIKNINKINIRFVYLTMYFCGTETFPTDAVGIVDPCHQVNAFISKDIKYIGTEINYKTTLICSIYKHDKLCAPWHTMRPRIYMLHAEATSLSNVHHARVKRPWMHLAQEENIIM